MAEASTATLEMTLDLPLAVVVRQLMRIETDLRALNMKALSFATERENGGLAERIAGRLGQITETLDSIRGLVTTIEADARPTAPDLTRVRPRAADGERNPERERKSERARNSERERVPERERWRKPEPERDD